VQAFVRLPVETVLQEIPIGSDGEHLRAHQIPIACRPRDMIALTEFRNFLEAAVLGNDTGQAPVERAVNPVRSAMRRSSEDCLTIAILQERPKQ